jgi:hypothetical protein
VKEEHILPLTLSKVLKYNLGEIGFNGKIGKFEVEY